MQIIAHEKITVYPGVPAMYIAILNHPQVADYDLRSIRVCLSGGASLPAEVAQQFEAMTGGKLVEGYGMSESSPLTAGNPVFGRDQDRLGRHALSQHRAGRRRPGVWTSRARLRFLDVGQTGELVVRGPQVMKGYYNNPEETSDAIDAAGWLHTGDIAAMDADGYFSIVDRKKDLIIASGYNIVPREVEEVLFTHPHVLEAAVVGVPDPKRGETVKAFVVLKARPERHGRRAARLLQGAPGPLQSARHDRIPHRAAQEPGRQDAAPHPGGGRKAQAGCRCQALDPRECLN
ncbi:MAG: AMP-binding protein [Anaerolineae bacterium]